jgi:hypothetical protein
LVGALLFDEKIRQNAALYWFGLRDVGTLYSQPGIQRTIDVSLALLEHGLAEKIPVEHMQTVIQTKFSRPIQWLPFLKYFCRMYSPI